MKQMTFIVFVLIALAVLGLVFCGGMGMERKLTTEPNPLDTVYLKYYGFKHIPGSKAWAYQVKTTCVPFQAIMSPAFDEKTKKSTWLLSVTADMKSGVSIDCMNTEKDFDRWMEVINIMP